MDNYNLIAENYDAFEQHAVTLWRLGYPVITDLLGVIKGKSVLDYGCGTGTFSRFLQEKGAIVTGVDVSENMIRVARKKGPATIDYHTISDGLDFLQDDTFDLVVSNFVLCTVSTRQEINRILSHIFRILKNDGLFVFMNSNWDKSNGKEFISFRLDYGKDLVSGQAVTAIIKSDPPILLHDFFWSVDDYFSMLSGSGFKIMDLKEPLANNEDEGWLDERKFPPYYIISAAKKRFVSP